MRKPEFVHPVFHQKIWDHQEDMWRSKWTWLCFIIWKYERHIVNYTAPWYQIDVLINPGYDMGERKHVKVKYKFKIKIKWPWELKKS